MKEEQAKERIEELRDYYGHLASYVGVNLFLFAINMFNNPDNIWFIYPLFGWGIGVLAHTVTVFWTGSDWEERKMQELTGLSDTREELERLSERTENLITILSSVDWEKIDPELLQTKTNLESARDTIVQLRQNHDANSEAEVAREIEKLEEFVTSSKFDYYDLASREDKQG